MLSPSLCFGVGVVSAALDAPVEDVAGNPASVPCVHCLNSGALWRAGLPPSADKDVLVMCHSGLV